LLMAASSSYPARSSDRARNAATQISTAFRTCPGREAVEEPFMPLSKGVRLLDSRWKSGQGWPKRLEWIEIKGIRGWIGERIEFNFPIVALVGENGIGKSTVLQAVAASFRGEPLHYASDFFPDTPWEDVSDAEIRSCVREGSTSGSMITSVRKPTERWRGNDQRKERSVEYIDLRRIQPIAARTGYARMAKREVIEKTFQSFDIDTVERLSEIMGRDYDRAKLSITDMDDHRSVPVLSKVGRWYSGFHAGAGETALVELLQRRINQYSMLLIDEVETSLHPRTQRRLIKDLATMCRNLELQCVLSTHSPYILDELPPEARIYLMENGGQRRIIAGVSPALAMTKMDDEVYPEADVYMEDERAATMINEIVAKSKQRDLILRYQTIPYGAANVGRALGMMAKEKRFPRPSIVFLDGDQASSDGCSLLPGGDAPERVVFEGLCAKGLDGVANRISRYASDVSDAANAAMLLSDHHEWVRFAADRLAIPGNLMWQRMCAEWCVRCLPESETNKLGDVILTTIIEYGGSHHTERPQVPVQARMFNPNA
jgi:predicted ATPase